MDEVAGMDEAAGTASQFRSGTGHAPPHPAGREREIEQFEKLLEQDDVILQNPLLTGARGAGKTALMETFRSRAHQAKWVWVGTVLTEAAGLTEERLATRMLTDLAAVVSSWTVAAEERIPGVGCPAKSDEGEVQATFDFLWKLYSETPGLASDKLKQILTLAGRWAREEGFRGIVFGCDEAQTLSDREREGEFPLALLLGVFQFVQRTGVPVMLLLAGLPTLPLKLVESRTFSERMFRTVLLAHTGAPAYGRQVRVAV